jgi:3-phosphoshikimate 1-carboxyvinyltransferase
MTSSKSISNRLLILNALSDSPFLIQNLSECDDTNVLLQILNSNSNKFDVGTAGSSMRFLTAYLSKIVGEWYLTGNIRMKQRPIGILVDAINKLGGHIEYAEKEGFPPLKIFGSALVGGEIELDSDISSQFVSALLMIGPSMQKGLIIKLMGFVTSEPYIQMTLSLMKKFGIKYKWENNVIQVLPCEYHPVPITVEGDWSSSAYWFEIVALSSENSTVLLKGLEQKSIQGDAKVLKLFKYLGVHGNFSSDGLHLEKRGTIVKNFKYDFRNFPDLAQTFAVTCTFLGIPFIFIGLHTLKIKETDRISALVNELRKFGFDIKSNNFDNLYWDGTKIEKHSNIIVETCNDHRKAMSFAPVAKKKKKLVIKNTEIVTKSYPEYWKDLKKIGFKVKEV